MALMADSGSFLFMLGLFVSVTVLLNPISCFAQQLFIFGDSLYDAGNKQYLSDNIVPSTSRPYGISIGKPTGRWSDGRIVPDFIAEFLGIPHVPPVLNKEADLSHGASFAVADATVLSTHQKTMNLGDQVRTFIQNKDKWTKKERAEALYLFYIGSDDYLNFTDIHFNPTLEQQKRFINKVNYQMEKVIRAIHSVGGRKFAFQNLAPLGCLPVVKQQYKRKSQCVELPSSMAAQHNKKLLQTLEKLSNTLDGFQYSAFDYFNSVLRRINSRKQYGYSKRNTACYGSGSENEVSLCTDPTGYLYFDGKHHTEKANEQMAHLMWSANPEISGPINLRELSVFPVTMSFDLGSQLRMHEDEKLEGSSYYSSF